MSRQLKFMHHILPSGHAVSIGYEFSDDKVGEVKIAATFKSMKDKFDEVEAETNINKNFAEGDYLSVIQESRQSVIKIVIDAFNNVLNKGIPSSWKRMYPKGIELCGSTYLQPKVYNLTTLHALRECKFNEIEDIEREISTIQINKLKRQIAKVAVEKYISKNKKEKVSLEKVANHARRYNAWQMKQSPQG